MTRQLLALLAVLILGITTAPNVWAEDTGWQSREDFRSSVYSLTEQSMVPQEIAVRIHNGEAQFRATWVAFDPNVHSGFALYPMLSRADAEEALATHRDTGGNIEVDELCLGRFATESKGGVEAWLVYLVDRQAQGVRCIQLPSK